MYLLKWWPMKPFTPRIRTFFKITSFDNASGERQRLLRQRLRHAIVGHSLAIYSQLQNLKAPAVGAVRIPTAVSHIETRASVPVAQWLRIQARFQYLKPTPVDLGKRA